MIRLKDTTCPHTRAFLEQAINVAEYYGFAPLDELPKSARVKSNSPADKPENDIAFARRDERALVGVARKALQCERPPHQTLLSWRIVSPSIANPAASFELHIVGTHSAIAEALLIVVAQAIAEEAGVEGRVLSINNIGSSESNGRYVRDVGTYLRKHLESISPTLRPRAATDPLGTLVQLIERGHPAVARAPQAMEYLTEEERRRFWELLEYLEAADMPYELNGQILGSRDCWSQALFEIASTDAETGARVPFAFGGRYDPLISRVNRSPAHGVMVSIQCEAVGKSDVTRQARGVASIYFAQLSPDARRRSLPVLETLRRAAIPVHMGIWYDRITEQMNTAKDLAVPYIIILGHKETMDGTVLVRDIATNSQDAVPVAEVAQYLRRRKATPSASHLYNR